MPINIGKNLKIEPTNDIKVSKFVRDYNQIHSYIDEKYQSEESNILLFDLLTSLLPSAVISYSNLPSGATFEWKIGSETLSNPANVKEGQVVEYTLTYSDGSKCVDSFVVSGDYTLDLSSLEPNKFIVTISADKTLTTVRVYHNYVDNTSPYIELPITQDNIYNIECDKNEKIRVTVRATGWSESAQTPDFDNNKAHIYSNITQNISETYTFAYESYISVSVYLKDEYGITIPLDDSYLQYITWTPSDSSKWRYEHIANNERYNAWKDKSVVANYTISIPNYAVITGSFAAQSTTSPSALAQTKTLIPMVTYTIVPYPSDATVTLAASGYTQQGNSITVPKGTNVVWMVAKDGYDTQSGNISVTSTQSVNVVLEESTIYGVDVTDYNYTNDNRTVVLTKYIGAGGNIVTPGLEEIIE